MMLAMLLAAAAQAGLAMPLDELPTQKLEPNRCVTFLWTRMQPPVRVAMIDEKTRTLRIRRDKVMDLAESADGAFSAGDLRISLDLDYRDQPGLTDGQLVDQGAMRIEQAGKDALVLPVAGLRACQ